MDTVNEFRGTTFVPCPGMYGGYVTQKARKAYRKKYRALLEGDMRTYHFLKKHIQENGWHTLSIHQVRKLVQAYPQYFRIDESVRHPKIWKFVRAGHKLFLTHVQQLG